MKKQILKITIFLGFFLMAAIKVKIPTLEARGIRKTVIKEKKWDSSIWEEKIRQNIYATLGENDNTLKIDFLNKQHSISIPIDAEIRQSLPKNLLKDKDKNKNSKIYPIRLEFFRKGRKFNSRTFLARIDRKINAYVLKRDMNRGELLTKECFEEVTLFTSNIPHRGILNPSSYFGWKLRTPVSKGKIIIPAQLKKVYLVKQGNLVTMLARKAGLFIRAMGYAKKNGIRNELIPIQNLSSKKTVLAKVIGKNTVKIEF